jgi:hypothetical protein
VSKVLSCLPVEYEPFICAWGTTGGVKEKMTLSSDSSITKPDYERGRKDSAEKNILSDRNRSFNCRES